MKNDLIVDIGLQILSMLWLLLPIGTTFLESVYTFLESVYPTLRFNGTSKYRKKSEFPRNTQIRLPAYTDQRKRERKSLLLLQDFNKSISSVQTSSLVRPIPAFVADLSSTYGEEWRRPMRISKLDAPIRTDFPLLYQKCRNSPKRTDVLILYGSNLQA